MCSSERRGGAQETNKKKTVTDRATELPLHRVYRARSTHAHELSNSRYSPPCLPGRSDASASGGSAGGGKGTERARGQPGCRSLRPAAAHPGFPSLPRHLEEDESTNKVKKGQTKKRKKKEASKKEKKKTEIHCRYKHGAKAFLFLRPMRTQRIKKWHQKCTEKFFLLTRNTKKIQRYTTTELGT